LFARKMRWRAYFNEVGDSQIERVDEEPGEELAQEVEVQEEGVQIKVPDRLKPKGSTQPLQLNTRLEELINIMSESG
jgi:hypothetical protein